MSVGMIEVHPLMTVQQVAAVLNVGQRTVWRMTSRAEAGFGNFPKPKRIASKTVRWRWDDIQKYLDENKFSNFSLTDGNLNWNDYDLIFPISDLYNGRIEA